MIFTRSSTCLSCRTHRLFWLLLADRFAAGLLDRATAITPDVRLADQLGLVFPLALELRALVLAVLLRQLDPTLSRTNSSPVTVHTPWGQSNRLNVIYGKVKRETLTLTLFSQVAGGPDPMGLCLLLSDIQSVTCFRACSATHPRISPVGKYCSSPLTISVTSAVGWWSVAGSPWLPPPLEMVFFQTTCCGTHLH